MSAAKSGLGRGLGALIPPPATGPAAGMAGVLNVPVGDIRPNPRQPRTTISAETLTELAASIKAHGVIQPLIVTRGRPTDPAPYLLIAGERRWRAAQAAGLAAVPVVVKEATPQQFIELALVENIQRADLNPLEEAAAYQSLMQEFGLSQQEVAERVGRSRAAVANIVRLLRLPERVKTLLAENTLSEGHARALLALPDDETITQAAEQVVARGLTVRQTEELARRLLAVAEAAQAAEEVSAAADDPAAAHTRRLEDEFRSVLGTKVSLMRGRRGGRLVIHFYSEEELQAIYQHIVGEG
ncbi:MAG: ParB/RepB/Spo0J family partition protein [Chloroflexi bacterium]|nr:ParB/RepB/Spo0J family partition protein [Chloroflexota bacterium]